MRPAIIQRSPILHLQRLRRCSWSLALCTVIASSGCGLFSGSQVKQLQAENDKLVSEYRALRDKASRQDETIATLEARNAEAEKMLARLGQSMPASRTAQAPSRLPASSSSTTSGSLPPYSPPVVPSLPETNSETPKWRPTKRQ